MVLLENFLNNGLAPDAILRGRVRYAVYSLIKLAAFQALYSD